VLKSLKRDCNYRKLTKKVASKVALAEIMKLNNFEDKVATPVHKLTATPDMESVAGIVPIHEMLSIIDAINMNLIRLQSNNKSLYVKDN
jgi:hypothetical protein